MKMITAVIQPFMLTKVTRALEEIDDFPGMTVIGVEGFGREKAHPDPATHRSRIEEVVDFVKKVRLEIVTPESLTERVIGAIQGVAHTGNRGDGKIFVWNVEDAVRIRTGERGEAALSTLHEAKGEGHEPETVS